MVFLLSFSSLCDSLNTVIMVAVMQRPVSFSLELHTNDKQEESLCSRQLKEC